MRRAVVAALAAAMLLAGCGEQPLAATRTAGADGRQIDVLVDQAALAAVGTDVERFLATRPGRITWGGGTADDIATTIEHGYRISVVVLPSGPALERVRDELVAPPVRLGTRGSTTYWACAVDQFGLPFVRFLTGRGSRQLLREHGFDVSPQA